jgi:hypothetical protein
MFPLNRKARKGRKETTRIHIPDGESPGRMARKISPLVLSWIGESWRVFAILPILAVKCSE